MLRIVPDVNVLVSGLINRRGPAGRVRVAWRREKLIFITSRIIIAKTDEVLHRPHIFNAFANIPILSPGEFVERYNI